jgi:hypothetical protein
MAVTQSELQKLYVAYFGRPADADGIAYYTNLPGVNIWDVAASFSASPESKALYGESVSYAMIDAIYMNLFNRHAEMDGYTYWAGKVAKHELTPAGVALAILLGAQNDDAICIQNKLAVAAEFTAGVNTPAEILGYAGAEAAAIARAFLHGVDYEAASVTAAEAGLNDAIEATCSRTGGNVFNLTAGKDGTADLMRLTGNMDARIDLTGTANQVKGLDLDGDGTIEINGSENVDPTKADDNTNFKVVDAYSRNPLNHLDKTHNFLGDIAFDGTGFGGDGVNTDGNIFLGGLGADTAYGGIGNDFLAGGGVAQGHSGGDVLSGGRNADFFFAELSDLDSTDGDYLTIDGGTTADDNSAGTTQSAQDADWMLFEASDDDEPVTIRLRDDTTLDVGEVTKTEVGSIVSRGGTQIGTVRDVENFDASGNLYGFLDNINVSLGGKTAAYVAGKPNNGIGSSAQLNVIGSEVANIIVGGYDNDHIEGNGGNDVLLGGNLDYLANPNLVGITNDGRDELIGGAGDDQVVFEADGGVAAGDAGNDTLWVTKNALGTKTAADLTSDGVLRFDLKSENIDASAGYGGADVGSRDNTANDNQDQTNYKAGGSRATVTGFENVIATGLGAIDYDTDGTNAGDVAHLSQVNLRGYQGDLDLRGTDSTGGTPTQTATTFSIELRFGIIPTPWTTFTAQYDGVLTQAQAQAKFMAENGALMAGVTGFQNASVSPVMTTSASSGGDNVLYANTGNDTIEGRGGNDKLSGGDGLDTFVFGTEDGPTSGQTYYGDGVDVIHRQADANNDNIWDGTYVQDFGVNSVTTAGASSLVVDFGGTDLHDPNVAVSSFSIKIGGVVFAVTDAQALSDINKAPSAAAAVAKLADLVNSAFHTKDAAVTAKVSGNTVVVSDATGRDISDTVAEGYAVGLVLSNGSASAQATFNPAGSATVADKIVYQSYEDRADGEKTDDDAILGSTISLGKDSYAQDRVVSFQADGTRIAEDQSYAVKFTNLTTQDKVTLTVNKVTYTLQVGIDLDGNIIAAEDGVNDTQAAIQTAFLTRLTAFINSFMDDDTAAGKVTAALNGSTITLTQAAYNGEETVFMQTPTVAFENLSGGELPSASITNTSQHEVHLLDFDGRNASLNAGNVLFLGDTGVNRSILATAKDAGGALTGTEAVLVDSGKDDLAGIAQNTTTNGNLNASNFSVHGDDLLIGGKGNDTITAGTGDDRVLGSLGTDSIDGGKDWYAVQVLGEAEARVFQLNTWEAKNSSKVAALSGLGTITSIKMIQQSEDGVALMDGFNDTLEFQQADFTANTTRFTVTLNDFTMNAGVVELRHGGAGTVGVDTDADGKIDSTTTFTNFENIRTVSGEGKAVAGDGQGNDTLDISALSSKAGGAGGVAYDLTNSADVANTATGAGKVSYSKDAILDPAIKGDNPVAADYEELVMKVDGVENVIAGTGDDLLLIDETEAAKNNTFSAGLGTDRIEYQNDFINDVGGVAQPTVTIKVNSATDTDTVTMTGGRVGTTVATDTLVGVEYISLFGHTAEGSRENDVLDVTSMTSGAVVDYTNGEVRDLAGNVQVTIQEIQELENVWGDGNDTVIVADADVMKTNARSDAGTAAGNDDQDIALATFVDFDQLSTAAATLNKRIPFLAQTTTQIEDVINQNQFTFNLSKTGSGADSDTVDYSKANDNISVVVELDTTKVNQYVLVDSDGATFYDAVGDLEEQGDRVDVLTSVERIVASQGESVLDLTASTKGVEIKYQPVDVANRVAALDRDVFTIQISDLSNSVPLTRNYVEYRDAKLDANITQATATWNRIEGSDNAERVVMSSAHSDNNNTMNLRGGANEVKYNELTRSITATLGVSDWDAKDPDGADNKMGTADDTGLITVTVKPQDGTGAGVEGPLLNGTVDTITSYTANNGIASGSLKIAASQDAEDTLKFQGLTDKLFLLSEVGTTDNQITVKLGSGTAENSVVLTGFELVSDADSNDVYDFGSLVNAAAGLQFTDNNVAVKNDHDTIKVGNDAIDVDGTNAMGAGAVLAGANEISLGALRDMGTLATTGFDFDVLDVTKAASAALTTLTGAMSGAAPGDGWVTDEVVIGKINNINSALNFESVVFTQDTVAENGTTFVLDTALNTVKAGAKAPIALSDNAATGNYLSFGGTVMEQAAVAGQTLRAATALNATTGVTVTVVGNEAVNITGGNGNDTITGSGGNDTLRGGQGNDTLDGNFVAEKQEVHTYTLTADAMAVAGGTLTIDGVTITEGVATQGVIVADNDADAYGAAFVREWTANKAAFGNNALIQSVTYDALTNALTFTFTSAAGNVADTILGAPAGTIAAVAGAETVTTAYAARAESADTIVFEATAALNGVDTINNFDATDTLNFTQFFAKSGWDGTAGAVNLGNVVTAGVQDLIVKGYNKATLSASDFGVGKITLLDNGSAVFITTGDADNIVDSTNDGYKVYFVRDTDATAGITYDVQLVGTINTATELTSSAILTVG